jgi:DNA polymerase (family 10)
MAEPKRRPDNRRVAKMLSDVADMLEIRGESRFRILAYRKAADEIRGLGRDVYDYVTEDRLRELPGVGKSIAEAVVEIVGTGTAGVYEDLKQSYPPSLVAVMDVQGVGPKKAKLLHDELGVDSVDALESAVQAHKLRDLTGFGEKSEQNIVRGLEMYRSQHERMPLADAFPLAEMVVGRLRELPETIEVSAAGSLRRMRETVGDLDILVSSESPDAVMDAFCGMPEVDHVLAKGPTRSTVVTYSGAQMDVRVIPPVSWGAALQYFTGNAEHNVKLREIAKRLGLKLNEYGVVRLSDGVTVASATESDVYTALGLEWIPPTMRQGKGEVEAAAEHALPRILALSDMRGDLHVHTHLSDGRDTLEALREKAASLGYEYLAITDHAQRLTVAGGLSQAQIEGQAAEIRALNASGGGPRLLTGIELNIANDGSLDFDDDFLASLDVVVASVHSGFNQSRETLTERTLAGLYNPHVDIVAHPTGRIIGRREPFAIDIQAVIEAAAETGTALELNSYPDRLDLRDEHLRLARGAGVKIAIDTDAHAVDQLGFMFYGVATADRAWLGPSDVVNAMGLQDLLAWLAR